MTQTLQSEHGALLVSDELPVRLPVARSRRGRKSSFAVWSQLLAVKLTGALEWLRSARQQQLAAKKLRVCETVALGDKRAIYLVQVDGHRFLLGGTQNSVSLLAQLDRGPMVAKGRRKKLNPQQAEA